MVGKLGRIAALFGSKTSLGTTSAHPSTITLCGDEDETRSEANLKRSWSFRLSKKKKKGIFKLIIIYIYFNPLSRIIIRTSILVS